MASEEVRLYKIISAGLELAEVRDEDMLLEKVLLEARKFFNADAGSIYIKDDNTLLFRCAQNDTLIKRLPPSRKLIYSTFTVPINHKSVAGYVAVSGETLNSPDVYSIPTDRPYLFDKNYDKISDYRSKSMLTTPLKTSRNKIIGVLQLINSKSESGEIVSFRPEDEPFLKHFANIAATAIERAQLVRTTILRMISMAELRDPHETGVHVNRVGAYSIEIYEAWAKKKGLKENEVERNKDTLRMAAMLHDVGKVAISDVILKKPDRFDENEFNMMKNHTTLGAKLFEDGQSEMDEMAAEIALNHHEKWNGAGYPNGKKGEEIPIMARIVAVADVYDALISKRSYKEEFSEREALKIIREESGGHFDPGITDAFFDSLDIIRAITQRYK